MTTQLSRNFTLEELTHSATAIEMHIANTPTPEHLANIKNWLVPGLEQVREICGGHRVNMHDAYRCPAVNHAVGGTATSAHPEGFAGDLDVEGQTTLSTFRRIAHAMRAGLIKVDQLIWESGRNTVHVSFDSRGAKPGEPSRARGMIGHQPGKPGTPIDWNFYKGEPS